MRRNKQMKTSNTIRTHLGNRKNILINKRVVKLYKESYINLDLAQWNIYIGKGLI